ncbi:MAG: TonB family protein [Acinetobacter sp.]
MTLATVIVAHIAVIWLIAQSLTPFNFTSPPKIDAMVVRFISQQQAQQVAITSAQAAPAQTEKPSHTPVVTPLDTQLKPQSEKPKVLVTTASPQKIREVSAKTSTIQKELTTPKETSEPTRPKPAQSQAMHPQADTGANQALNAMGEHGTAKNGQDQKQSGGVLTGHRQQSSKAANSQVVKEQPIQVSSVDILNFGGFKYDDRELLNQNRLVVLTIVIDENGKATSVKIKKSSEIESLDQRALKSAYKAKFKPQKINGAASTIVVDVPIQLKLSRSR